MCILSVHGAIESKRRLDSCCIGASRAIPLFILFLPYCVRIQGCLWGNSCSFGLSYCFFSFSLLSDIRF